MTYLPRSRGRYARRKRCRYPAVECDQLALEQWPYCDTHRARLVGIAADLKKWGPKPQETMRRRET